MYLIPYTILINKIDLKLAKIELDSVSKLFIYVFQNIFNVLVLTMAVIDSIVVTLPISVEDFICQL